jgi:Zn-dependent protease
VQPDLIVLGLTWFVVFLFSTTLHEAAHALTAYKLGDPTAYEGGQVTLNPLPHIRREPFGMVIVPLLYFALTRNGVIGWASAPYDPRWAQHYPKRAAVMAAAGPAANLLLAVLGGLLLRFSAVQEGTGAANLLWILFSLNLLLFVFNLLPMPPLDGSAILPALMSENLAQRYREIIHQPMFSLLGLLVAWQVFPYLFRPIQAIALQIFFPGAVFR